MSENSRFLKIESLGFDNFKPKSIYDLKLKIKNEDLKIVINYLLKIIANSNIDPDVYFRLKSAKNVNELGIVIFELLNNKNSRKYDDNVRHMLYTLGYLLKLNLR